LSIPGRNLSGVYFAMDYLMQSNRRVSGKKFSDKELIDAKDKKVVVIGGGDTGSDCVGTANRQGAVCVVQIELLPQPPECRPNDQPWPKYPMILKTSSSHEEGANRQWAILTKEFIGQNGKLTKLSCVKVEFVKDEKGCPQMKEVPGSNFQIEADMAVLAMGFIGPVRTDIVSELKLELDQRGNVKAGADFMTSQKGVFSCGDMRRGQSLIVWAISEGRKTAAAIDAYLMGSTNLPVV
jgi:glutamate synthase (NADPH/NADH) small chain